MGAFASDGVAHVAGLHISAARADPAVFLSLAVGHRISRADLVRLANGRRTSHCFSATRDRRCMVRQVAVGGFTDHGLSDLADDGRLFDSGPRSVLAPRWAIVIYAVGLLRMPLSFIFTAWGRATEIGAVQRQFMAVIGYVQNVMALCQNYDFACSCPIWWLGGDEAGRMISVPIAP